jgi:hypothetical protein
MDLEEAMRRYVKQQDNAKRRGIEWEFTFEEWCEIWALHWDKRGPGKDQLVMCRTHDQGPYAKGNVRLDSPKGNAAERGMMQRCSRSYMRPTRSAPESGLLSYGNKFTNPEIALELSRGEREFEPYS